jgi:integral membrane protein
VTAARRTRLTRAFSVVALTEAVTWGGLLVGMLLEHVLHVTSLGVYVFGRLHGAAFLAYVVLALATWWSQRWTPATGMLSLASAIPPFGTAVFERWARRTGRLDARAEDRTGTSARA